MCWRMSAYSSGVACQELPKFTIIPFQYPQAYTQNTSNSFNPFRKKFRLTSFQRFSPISLLLTFRVHLVCGAPSVHPRWLVQLGPPQLAKLSGSSKGINTFPQSWLVPRRHLFTFLLSPVSQAYGRFRNQILRPRKRPGRSIKVAMVSF